MSLTISPSVGDDNVCKTTNRASLVSGAALSGVNRSTSAVSSSGHRVMPGLYSDSQVGQNMFESVAQDAILCDLPWRGHSDARQVSDLPGKPFLDPAVYDRGSETFRRKGLGAGKSETCRVSEWQSHQPSCAIRKLTTCATPSALAQTESLQSA